MEKFNDVDKTINTVLRMSTYNCGTRYSVLNYIKVHKVVMLALKKRRDNENKGKIEIDVNKGSICKRVLCVLASPAITIKESEKE